MAFSELIGRVGKMWVRRLGPHGALLVDDPRAPSDTPLLLLPNRDVPADASEGLELEVFVYFDSEDRPIATTQPPRLELGEVTFLACTDLTSFGAFFDWGLAKDLLVSKREQTHDVRLGDRLPIGLVRDDQGRLAGSMRVSEMFNVRPSYAIGDWVHGEAWRVDPDRGCFVILDRKYVGLVPRNEPNGLRRGDAARFRVAALLDDGKLQLSLRALAHEQLDDDGQLILAALRGKSPPKLGDHSSPEAVRARFALSKKAFKRAVGRLLKEGLVRLDADGHVALPDGAATSTPSGARAPTLTPPRPKPTDRRD